MLFICSGIYILLLGIDSKKKSLFLWSGLFFGLGLLIKQNSLVFIGLPVVYFYWALLKKSHQSRRSWFDALCFFTFGYFIPLAIFFIFCFYIENSFFPDTLKNFKILFYTIAVFVIIGFLK